MKKAIVIGATSGIGKEIAILLSNQDFKVGITGRRTELLEQLKEKNPNKFIVSSFDLTDFDNIERNLNNLVCKLDGVDLIILSSGDGLIDEPLDFEIQKRIMDLNINGFTIVANYAYNYFTKQKFGHFCAITSIAGIRGNRRSLGYAATKSYQINYLQGLTQKATKSKLPVYVTDARPGYVDTQMGKGDKIFWMSSSKKAALQIFIGIKRRRKVIYITKRWRIIAVLIKILPRILYNNI